MRWSVTAAGWALSPPERSLPRKLILLHVAQDMHCRVEKSAHCGDEGTGGGLVPASLVSGCGVWR